MKQNPSLVHESTWLENVPLWIILTAVGVTTMGLATWVSWLATGDWTLVNAFFRYPNAVFTVVVGVAQVLLSLEAWRRFPADSPLRSAWLWLSLAAMMHLAGRVLALPGSNDVPATQSMSMNELGTIVSGPLRMSLMLAGLSTVILSARRLGMLRGLTKLDYALLAGVAAFSVRTYVGVSAYLSQGKPVTFTVAALWTSDPLLLLLLAAAVLLRRSVAALGHGLIANCWRSYIAAIVLTSLGSASAWCLDCSSIPLWTSAGWYIWFVADCAFALGPALQVAAMEHARSRQRIFETFTDAAFWRVP